MHLLRPLLGKHPFLKNNKNNNKYLQVKSSLCNHMARLILILSLHLLQAGLKTFLFHLRLAKKIKWLESNNNSKLMKTNQSKMKYSSQ